MNHKALLLPWVCRIFLGTYTESHASSNSEPTSELVLEVGESSVKFKAQWLLNQLIIHLHQYMSYRCMYRRGGDLLTSLSWALSNSHLHSETATICATDTNNKVTNKLLLQQASHILDRLTIREQKNGNDNTSLSFDYLQNTDPLLVQFMLSMMSTAQEASGFEQELNSAKPIKKVRLYSLLCLILFYKNHKRSTSLQNILADAVEVCSGSCQLLKILNRLGCTSSSDTHDRLVTQYAEARHQESIWDVMS